MGKRVCWCKGLTKETDARLARHSEIMKGKVPWMKGKHHTPEANEANRQAHLGRTSWAKGLTKADHSSLARMAKKMSKLQLRKCKNPEYALGMVTHITRRPRDVKPNKPEKQLIAILDKYFPNQWRYVGNGEMTLGRKIPDFVNVDGKKQIIEVFGHYWHRGEDPQKRIDEFKQFGFTTLVIWEDELKDEAAVVEQIQNLKCVEHIEELPFNKGNDMCRTYPKG